MKTIKTLALTLVLAGAAFASAEPPVQTAPTTVSITARGTDVKAVLADLFAQAQKNYVIQPGTFFALSLNLTKIDFDEALMIVTQQANLKIDIQNGIYYVTRIPAKPTIDTSVTTIKIKPLGTLPKTVLTKKISTHDTKIAISDLFAEITKKTGVSIEIDKSVPSYKLDAFLTGTTLKYALDQITTAAGLQYKFTDNLTILIFKPKAPVDPNHIKIIPNG